jgi:hypothetical protein
LIQNNCEKMPHAERRWLANKELFLQGLLACAGRRHVLGADDSGCLSPKRGTPRATKVTAFTEWDTENRIEPGASSRQTNDGKSGGTKIDDFALALRPMITLYAILDKLSSVFVVNMSDELVEQSVAQVVQKVEDCLKTKDIHELLIVAGVDMDHDQIMEEVQKGLVSA